MSDQMDETDFEVVLLQVRRMSAEQLLELNKLTAEVFKRKRRAEGAQMMGQIHEGMRVMLSGTIKPAYLQRQLATVTEIRQTRVVVKLDRPQGKFRNGIVVLSPALLTVLKNQPTS